MEVKYSGNIVIQANNPARKFLADIRYLPNGKPKPIVLFVHGFKGFKDWGAFNVMADYFANNGFVFAKINLSHNGTTVEEPLDFADLEAFGNNNFSIEQDDIQATIDALLKDGLVISSEANLSEIYLVGHSRGGGAAILKTLDDDRIKKLATLAAINDFKGRYSEEVLELWKKEGVYYIYNDRTGQKMPMYYQIVKDYLDNEERLNVKQAIKKMNKPFIALHGTADETLPVSMLHEIKSWNGKVETIEIDDANHIFGSIHPYTSEELPIDLKLAVDHIILFFKK